MGVLIYCSTNGYDSEFNATIQYYFKHKTFVDLLLNQNHVTINDVIMQKRITIFGYNRHYYSVSEYARENFSCADLYCNEAGEIVAMLNQTLF